MPEQLTYPGVYVREKPSGVRTITGVATSVTAFVGSAAQGPLQDPQLIESFADFVRSFGALAAKHRLGYAVQDYFRNGGGQAIIVRVATDDAAATQFDLSPAANPNPNPNPNPPPDPPGLVLEARSPGAWADGLTVTVDHDTRPDANGQPLAGEFNLTVTGSDPDALPESLRNVSADPAAARYVKRVLAAESRYLRAADDAKVEVARPDAGEFNSTTAGSDGAAIGADDLLGDAAEGTGVYALAKADIFNLLVIPPPAEDTPTPLHVYRTALEFCRERRAVLLADAVLDDDAGAGTYLGDDWKAKAPQMIQAFGPGGKGAEYGAVYFPRLRRGVELVPSTPSVAGAIARNDTLRGIWKAPAGIEAQIDADGVAIALDDAGSGNLNPQGVNVVRTLPLYGTVIWGARTLAGSDQIGSEYKYLSVRRTALFIEETLFRALKWVVFEPNDEPLWGQIRLNVGAFMQGLFKQGAFQGTSPRDAYFVKCDKETTTQNDIDLGIVNVVVGFAPLKPAEFVVITIQQIAGQLQT